MKKVITKEVIETFETGIELENVSEIDNEEESNESDDSCQITDQEMAVIFMQTKERMKKSSINSDKEEYVEREMIKLGKMCRVINPNFIEYIGEFDPFAIIGQGIKYIIHDDGMLFEMLRWEFDIKQEWIDSNFPSNSLLRYREIKLAKLLTTDS